MQINRNPEDILNTDWLRRFKETKDVSLFGAVYQQYIPLVYGLCIKYLSEKAAAQDAVMDIFEIVLEKLPQYEVENFKTWLYSVAKNHCFQLLRKKQAHDFVKIEDSVMENGDFLTLIEENQTEEEIKALEYCLQTLPEEQRNSISLFYFEDKSYADIVEKTGFALNKVKSYIQNGKRNLKICIINVLEVTE